MDPLWIDGELQALQPPVDFSREAEGRIPKIFLLAYAQVPKRIGIGRRHLEAIFDAERRERLNGQKECTRAPKGACDGEVGEGG